MTRGGARVAEAGEQTTTTYYRICWLHGVM